MITPTPGRVVWYYPDAREGFTVIDQSQPCAATVAFVHSDTMINVTVHDHAGVVHSLQSVRLVQPEEVLHGLPPSVGTCHWMPFQKGQAQAADTVALGWTKQDPTPNVHELVALLELHGQGNVQLKPDGTVWVRNGSNKQPEAPANG